MRYPWNPDKLEALYRLRMLKCVPASLINKKALMVSMLWAVAAAFGDNPFVSAQKLLTGNWFD
ncbi:hypothetical protein OK016_10485 [Vibrio chagasii]|nr:hypothetical protein [Vibrio chagasii]